MTERHAIESFLKSLHANCTVEYTPFLLKVRYDFCSHVFFEERYNNNFFPALVADLLHKQFCVKFLKMHIHIHDDYVFYFFDGKHCGISLMEE